MPDEIKTCVACAEEIKGGATLCRFCGTRQDDPRFDKSEAEPVDEPRPPDSGLVATSRKNPLPTPTALEKKSKGPIFILMGVVAAIAVLASAIFIDATTPALETLPPPNASQAEEQIGGSFDDPVPPGEVSVKELIPGSCVNDLSLEPDEIHYSVPVVDCSDPHDSEIFLVGDLTYDYYPSISQLSTFLESLCAEGFSSYVGENPEDSNLAYSFWVPVEEEWEKGYERYHCILWDPQGQKTGSAKGTSTEANNLDVGDIYEQVIDSVVTVFCPGVSQGSGFGFDVMPAEGYASAVVTNFHVIEECSYDGYRTVEIDTSTGQTIYGFVWNWDEENDLALIMVDAYVPPIQPAEDGRVGDPVIAIGSPLGFAGTLTQGIISQVYSDAYQTDASINPGNSGGPLLDMSGRLLGINTLGFEGGGINIAFRHEVLCERVLVCD